VETNLCPKVVNSILAGNILRTSLGLLFDFSNAMYMGSFLKKL
jgi:hypothetical protein